MVTRLTFADYNDADWGPIDLSDDYRTYRALWTSVLRLATADHGGAVHYQLDAGEGCLAIEIGGQNYLMQPPPEEYRKELLLAGKRLAAGGSIRLETSCGDVTWHVRDARSGLLMTRIT